MVHHGREARGKVSQGGGPAQVDAQVNWLEKIQTKIFQYLVLKVRWQKSRWKTMWLSYQGHRQGDFHKNGFAKWQLNWSWTLAVSL